VAAEAAGAAGAQAALALLQPSARAREYLCGSSDEDEPLQARLRSLFPAGGSSSLGTASPVVVAVAAAGAEAATDRRAAEEAAAKEAAGEGSSVPGQVPSSAAGAKRAATPSGSSPPAKRPYRGVWRPRYAPKSLRPVCFVFFLRGSLLQLSIFQIVTGA
jgi:hypothetical protein